MSAQEKVNILLVDDQPGKLLAYEAILADLGETLIKASSGREALELLLRNDITIVLMDVSMPDLDGFELASIIRQHPRYQETAIIFVSAVHLTDLDRIRGYRSGAVDYVSVPIIPELLRAKVSVFAELYRKTRESERLTKELEQRVVERTSELQDALNRQSELAEQLRRADRRKDEFLALLAHELRNPLAPVRNAAQVIALRAPQDQQLMWCHEVIERQISQLTRLVDDLLDVSRITRGKVKLRLELVDLVEIAARAVETSRPVIDAHRQHLYLDLPAEQLMLHGDRTRLIQVIANLLNNAARYQQESGKVELRVRRDGPESVVSVRDEGIGIAPEMLTQVFELFSQGERAPDRAEGGLGIGLSLVKELVELHGGRVTVRSDGPGQGSEFEVRLPAVPVQGSSGTGEQLAVSSGPGNGREKWKTGEHNAAPSRILVVDDSRDAAESMAMLLRLGGHEVSVAHNGVDALKAANDIRPSVIFLDIGLPGMDGYEVCRRAREMGHARTRIIAVTGYGQDKDRQRAQSAGFDAHVVKPVPYTQLARLLAD
ncbi:MAG: ATP-binding response regulator [Gemmatimonadota bacterium]